MIYLLDTNVCITYLRGKNLVLKQRGRRPQAFGHRSLFGGACRTSVRAAMSKQPAGNHAQVQSFATGFISLPFDDVAAGRFGDLRAHLDKLGTPVGPYDLMIASIALSNGLTVVTHNTSEFGRVPGLTLIDWQIP